MLLQLNVACTFSRPSLAIAHESSPILKNEFSQRIGEGLIVPGAARGLPLYRPASTSSGFPPTRVAITGSPLAIASSTVLEMPSPQRRQHKHVHGS